MPRLEIQEEDNAGRTTHLQTRPIHTGRTCPGTRQELCFLCPRVEAHTRTNGDGNHAGRQQAASSPDQTGRLAPGTTPHDAHHAHTPKIFRIPPLVTPRPTNQIRRVNAWRKRKMKKAIQIKHIQPGKCPKCKKPRRLNTITFLCDCGDIVKREHTWLAYQYPVYQNAPQIFKALQAALKWIENLDDLGAGLDICEDGDREPHIEAMRKAVSLAEHKGGA